MLDPEEPQATVTPLLVPEIVTLPAEIDALNATLVGRQLTGALALGPRVVIADMSMTGYCDSSGLKRLLIADDAARRAGSELRIVASSAGVLRLMQILGIDQVLHIYGSLDEALSGRPDLEPEG